MAQEILKQILQAGVPVVLLLLGGAILILAKEYRLL